MRVRIMLGVGIPVLVVLLLFSLIHIAREIRLVQGQTRAMAAQLGQVLSGSLEHEMAAHDSAMLQQALSDITKSEVIDLVELVNLDGEVIQASDPQYLGKVYQVDAPGCIECHSVDAANRPETRLFMEDEGILRIAVPVQNSPECQQCHGSETPHLGAFLIDAPLALLEEHVREDVRIDFLYSIGIVILLLAYIYWQIYRMVVRRVEVMRTSLQGYAQGDFHIRLPASPEGDSLNALALTFNQMAAELQQHTEKEARRMELQRQTIVDERERIARELHDGFAQLLSYANTRLAAIRLFLQKKQPDRVLENLDKMDEVLQQMFVDVREAIVGLRMTGDFSSSLAEMLKNYVEQFRRFSDLAVKLNLDPDIDLYDLPPETEIQMLRVSQEALSNIRKHARAKTVTVDLLREDGCLVLRISDDGIGFDVDRICDDSWPHFGLCTMQERVASLGGEFTVESTPGEGTCVTARIPIKKKGGC